MEVGRTPPGDNGSGIAASGAAADGRSAGSRLPGSGLLTLLFTDIEGSTKLVSALGDDRWAELLETHRRLILEALADAQAPDGAWGPVGTEGDSFFVVFSSPIAAARGAVAAQRALAAYAWPDGATIRVRMGLHAGEALRAGDDYVGYEVHKAARVANAAHGGQIVLSRTMRELIPTTGVADLEVRALGVHRLKDVPEPEELFQLVAPGLATEFPPLRTLDSRSDNLPVQLTTFVGRGSELEEVKRRLAGTRLLTLTGPGGTGKTRLALRAGEEVAGDYRDGAWFVPLATITDPALVPSAIAAALRIPEVPGTSALDRLRDVLADRRQLVILDNFEQIQAAAPVVTELLRAASGLSFVVTSRAGLRVYGEHELPVPPLRLPDPDRLPSLERISRFEAVALFIERAQAVRPDFAMTDDNARAIVEICARLDGLPLAIELAAARVRVLTPQAILARLGSRLDLLAAGSRDLPERQQTLRGAIAWSHDLLERGEQRLFARLSVFVGGCLLEEAEAVCGPPAEVSGDVLDGLSSLVGQSLVRQEEEPDGEPRFGMLETIREFGLERLSASGEEAEIRSRHARVYLDLVERAAPELTRDRAKGWLDRLERSTANLRTALECAIAEDATETALRLGWALWRFWQMRGTLDEGRDWLDRLLALPHATEHPALLAKAHEAAGSVAYWRGDMTQAERSYQTALDIQRTLDDPAGLANALYNLSFVYSVPKTDMPRADDLLHQALAIYETLGDEAGIGNVHFALNNTALERGDLASIREHVAIAAPIFRRRGDRYMLAWVLHMASLSGLRSGELGEVRANLTEALGLLASARDVPGIALLLDDWAELALAEGDIVRSVRLAGAAAAFQASSGADLGSVINKAEGRARPGGRAYDQETLAAAWAAGQAMSIDEAVADALGPTAGPGPAA